MDRIVFERMATLEDEHWWFVARRNVIAALINRYIELPEQAKILEAGCGTGGNLKLLQGYGHLSAFEYDERARTVAKVKSGIDVQAGALPDCLPFQGKQFDLICMLDVLEHIGNDTTSLVALSHRLSADGRLLVTVPAYPWLWSKHDEVHHHYRRYNKKDLLNIAHEAGLKVERVFHFNMLLFPLALLFRFGKWLLNSNRPDEEMPSLWMNTLLREIFSLEQHMVGRAFSMPFGLTVGAILSKNNSS
ncbi:class I SAM-dependent methyltransferase [Shewanella insulae]|uniref:class I SAM-dependent methyltransferase n=1 Tax=Shewanella insulae TaxID=2681496 RepID=UPI0024812F72|nr:class I SAM-dependent methyltransferase [Shewanella insulae]